MGLLIKFTQQELVAKLKKEGIERERAETAKRNAEIEKFKKEVQSRKFTTSKDIGKTICKETKVWNIGISGIEKKLYNGSNVVMGVLEQYPNNSTNIKVSLLGLMTTNGNPLAMPSANFNYIPLEAGLQIWEPHFDWYICQ